VLSDLRLPILVMLLYSYLKEAIMGEPTIYNMHNLLVLNRAFQKKR
jgi:hypothetical protein